MAGQVIQLDRETLSCSICLDLLKDPVTIPCGHSYCMSCIKDCWDEEDKRKGTTSCPQCRKNFTPRPVLVKSTLLAGFVEELKKLGVRTASPDRFYAGPGDVACDLCSGRKLKAIKSCLACMVSYCEQHLQPHYDAAPLKRHKLVEVTSKLQENICSRHDEVMKIFCRTDQHCICYLCCLDEHKGHDTVTAAAARAERQTELGASRQKIQQRVLDREKDVKVLQLRAESINLSADKAVRDGKKIFAGLIRLIEKRSYEFKDRIKSQQRTQVRRVEELEEKLQREIADLRRKDAGLEQLSRTEDHLYFLNNYPSLSRLDVSEDSPGLDAGPLSSFEDVAAAVSEARDKLQAVLSDDWRKISLLVTEVDVLPPPAEPRTRNEFMKYSRQVTLDPNTANKHLSLSDGERKATLMENEQLYVNHPDRFISRWQVLSRDGLTGRCYWEVNRGGNIHIAVAYKNISRTGGNCESGFGYTDKSWSLDCRTRGFTFKHNNTKTSISGPESSRIGVYLDHRAGTLSFYSVSETMTLLHRVQTTFTQPLYPGLWLPNKAGDSAELCELK